MIDELIGIHTEFAAHVHQSLTAQQECAGLDDVAASEDAESPEGVEMTCPDKNQLPN